MNLDQHHLDQICAVERRSIIRGDPRWLQIVYRNARAFLEFIKACPRLLIKMITPAILIPGLCTTAVNQSDFGARIVDFFKHPTLTGFFNPILLLLGWLLLLFGGLALGWGLYIVTMACVRPSPRVSKQLGDTTTQTTGDTGSIPRVERSDQDTEHTMEIVSDGLDQPQRPEMPWGRGPKWWLFGCFAISQLVMVFAVFVPGILMIDLEKWADDSGAAIAFSDMVFLLSLLLALILAAELLALVLCFVLITFGDIMLDEGVPVNEA